LKGAIKSLEISAVNAEATYSGLEITAIITKASKSWV
jgi:molybdopterin-binding protein